MAWWDITAAAYNWTFTIFFFVLTVLMVVIARRGYKSGNLYGCVSTLVCGSLFLILGLYNMTIGFLPYPYNGYMVWWIGIILSIYLGFGLFVKRIIKNLETGKKKASGKQSPLAKYVELVRKENPYQEQISIKMEGVRKSFHLVGLLIPLAYFGFFFIPPITLLISDNVFVYVHQIEAAYYPLWGDLSAFPYTLGDFQAIVDLTMFALIATLIFAIISELIRVLWGTEYSLYSLLTSAVLRNKEFNSMGPQIQLVTGAIFAYWIYTLGWIPISAAMAAILIACLSDAAAALIGRKYGKHKVTCVGGEIKSIEGFIAGVGSAYLIGLVCVGPLYAIIGAVIFFLLDYFPIKIADNLLNPIVISIGLGIAMALIRIPIL